MNVIKPTILGGFLAATLLTLTGCPFVPNRTNNQGGGNILTAGTKIAGGSMTTLTPDEVQVVTDTVKDVANNPDLPQVTDEQAQVAVDFLRLNNLNSVDDIRNFIEEAAANPESVEIPDSVFDLIEAGGLPDISGLTPDDFEVLLP